MRNTILVLSCIFAIGSCVEKSSESGDKSKYCDLSKSHVLCMYPEMRKDCNESFTEIIPNEEQQREIVDWHNKIRRNIALGLEFRGAGRRRQPSAANMMKMDWDPELARIAQRTANQCMFNQDCAKCIGVIGERFNVGQIVTRSRKPSKYLSTDFMKLIENFYEEVELFNSTLINSFVPSRKYNRYTQIVWWNTRSVGCGGSKFRSQGNPLFYEFLVYCNYGPAGNFASEKVYAKGHACTRCPQGTSCDSHFRGLCSITKEPFDVQEEFPTDKMHL